MSDLIDELNSGTVGIGLNRRAITEIERLSSELKALNEAHDRTVEGWQAVIADNERQSSEGAAKDEKIKYLCACLEEAGIDSSAAMQAEPVLVSEELAPKEG